jgi:hypothetical protein
MPDVTGICLLCNEELFSEREDPETPTDDERETLLRLAREMKRRKELNTAQLEALEDGMGPPHA